MISFAVLLILLSIIKTSVGLQVELTFLLNANERFCFYQQLDKDLKVNMDYFVVRGEKRDLLMEVLPPSSQTLLFQKVDGDGDFEVNRTLEHGDYHFCFDNRLSNSYGAKFVNFFLTTNDAYFDPEFKSAPEIYERKKDDIEVELENSIREVFDSVENRLDVSEHLQGYFKHYDRYDLYLMESILDRINFWSLLNTILMVFSSIFQVIFIQRFFKMNMKFKSSP